MPKPWTGTFVAAGAAMAETLHLNNPAADYVLDLWNEPFNELRLAESQKLKDTAMPFELNEVIDGLTVR